MALREKWVTFRFTDGLNTESNPKTLNLGEFTRLENQVFTENVTTVKRFGTETLGIRVIGDTYSQLSGALGLAARDDEHDLVALASTDEVFSRVGEDLNGTSDGWMKGGDWWNGRIEELPLPRRAYEAFDGSTASSGTLRLNAWQDGRGGVYAQKWDDARGGMVGRDFRVGGGLGVRPLVQVVGSNFHVYFASGSSLMVGVVPTVGTPGVGVVINELYSQMNASGDFDAVGSGALGYVTYLSADSNAHLSVVTEEGFVGTSRTVPAFLTGSVSVSSASLGGLSLAASPDHQFLAVSFVSTAHTPLFHAYWPPSYVGNGLQLVVDDKPLDASVNGGASGTVRRLGSSFDPDPTRSPQLLHVFVELSASEPWLRQVRHSTAGVVPDYIVAVSGNVATTSGSFLRHSTLGSKPFPMGGRTYVYVAQVSDEQPVEFLCREDGLVCGWSRFGQVVTDVSGGLGCVDVGLPGAYDGLTAHRCVANRELVPLPGTSGSTYSDRHVLMTRTVHHPSSSWRPVDVDGCLMMPGGWLGKYDGSYVTENGHALLVENLSGTISSSSLGRTGILDARDMADYPTLSVNYLYTVIPEAFDARGNRDLGAYISALQVTLTGSATGVQNTVTLTIPTVSHTMRDGTRAPLARFAVYRTGPNDVVPQRIDDPAYPLVNDPTVDHVTFVDTVSELARASGEVDYTVFEDKNFMPAAPTTLALAGDRLYLAGLEGDPYTVAVSKVRGGGAISFSAAGTVAFESVGGPITALHALDDNVIAAFKRSKVYALVADGPSNVSSDTTPFPLPVLKTSDVGAPYPPTTLSFAGETLQGVLFASERGIRLLDRSATVQNVGWPVKKFDDHHVVGGSAPRLAEEARFYTSEGETLVLNTRFSRWSTFPGEYAVGATVWDGRPAFVREDGLVHVETTSSYLDGLHPFGSVAETGWIPLDAPALQGLSRVRYIDILGEFYSPHTLRVEMAIDYRDSWVVVREAATSTFMSGAVVYGGPTGSVTFVSASSPFGGFGTFNGQTVGIDAFSGSTAMADHILGVWSNGLQFKIQTGAAEVGYLESVAARSGTFYSVNGDTTALQLQQALTGSRLFRLDPKAVSLEDTFVSNAGAILLEADLTGGLGTVLSGSYGEGHYGGVDPVYRLRINMPTQKVTTIRLRISDVGTSGNGRGMSLTELRLRVATDGGKADLTRGRQW